MSEEVIATQPEDRVLYYANGLHDYITATVIRNFTNRLMPGRYYVISYTRQGGFFIVELNEAETKEQAQLHKNIVINEFVSGDIVVYYLMRVISGGGNDYVVHWSPFEYTEPFMMSFDENGFYTNHTIH